MKLKKLLCAFFAIAMIIGAMNLGGITAKAAKLNLDEADLCLMDTLELMVDEDLQTLSYNRQEIYNYNLEPFGYAYETEINGKTGFAMMIKRAYYYEVTEFYFKTSPYDNISGLPVYLTSMCYIEYINEQFIDIENDIILDEEQLICLTEKGFGYQDDGYGSSSDGQIIGYTVSYDFRVPDESRISGGIPSYFDLNVNLSNTCAVQAGAVVVGYYSRYFPQLTPGFTVGMEWPPSYIYYTQGGATGVIQGIINDLYVRMGTNVGGAGTTAAGFREGLKTYVISKGKNITYTNMVTNNTLNYDLYRTQIANLKPIVLFFNTYNTVRPPAVAYIDDHNDGVEYKAFPGMHVMIGYGYKKYMYYRDGSIFRTDYYLEVYTGIDECAKGFVKLYEASILVEAQAINIY